MKTRFDSPMPPPPDIRRAPCRFLHVSVDARRRYAIEGQLFGLSGRLMLGDAGQAQKLAWRINQVRRADRFPELAVSGGELYAAVLLHELMHALIAAVSERAASRPFARAHEGLERALGRKRLESTLTAFTARFPPPAVADGHVDAAAHVTGAGDRVPNAEIVLEEALLLRLANANAAMERLQELFDDAPLRVHDDYTRTLALLEERLEGVFLATDAGASGHESLMALLWAPQRASPTSLEGQLRVVAQRWGPLLGERYAGLLSRLLRSIDVLREERVRGPGGPGPAPVLDAEALRLAGEHEAFSPDSDWMPRVVLIAKSTYVWLAQLQRRYGREVRRLDQIPDEALDELAERGFNGLWLIGLWERSQASRRIKQRRGQDAALASAYALYDYVIAGDLGGEAAFRELERRAQRRGIRLAGDMVPNHVGIDGRWVAEHPDWFLQLDHPPYPGYRFDGPDLSSDPAMAVVIEDHYWDDSDAAVVFKRVGRSDGEVRFIYHGNDGTSMPWNDTAQLDYLDPAVREAVIQTILHVARLVPIIRFDAAMTLAKRHIQRLWYPPPGEGGAIPSRSAYGSLEAAEFERRIPVEFWREVVDRVAAEAPGTLLLAEAFWMMEGYFVRTLGVCVVMATMPGLPMFGHGQVEGFREKYGMEYHAPTFDEEPDPRMLERHGREIAPLLKHRERFAAAESFRLFDAVDGHGNVNEDVYAYSNRGGGAATLVLYNNRYARASGVVRTSVPFAEPWAGGGTRRMTLHQALGLEGGANRFTLLREGLRGLEYLRRSDQLMHDGLSYALDGFQAQVFTDVLEVTDRDGSFAGLHDALGGAGVPDVERARLDWLHRDVRERFVALLSAARDGGEVEAAAVAFVAAARARGPLLAAAAARHGDRSAGPEGATEKGAAALAKRVASALMRRPPARKGGAQRADDAGPPARDAVGAALARLDAAGYDVVEAAARGAGPTARAALALASVADGADRYASLRLAGALEAQLAADGVDDAAAAADLPPVLVRLLAVGDGALPWEAATVLRWLHDDDAGRAFLGVHDYGGERWFVRERFRLLAAAVLTLAAAAGASAAAVARLGDGLRHAEEASGYRFDRLEAAPTAARAPRAPRKRPAKKGSAKKGTTRTGAAKKDPGAKGPGEERSANGRPAKSGSAGPSQPAPGDDRGGSGRTRSGRAGGGEERDGAEGDTED
ncbi:MAG: alpha-amylase family glycosyl hydrolase [Deinococcales bacterium]